MVEKAQLVEDHVLLLSIHDVSPHFEDDVIKTYDTLMNCGVSDFSLLLTPLYQMKRSNSFEKHELFSEYLQSLGMELVLHGLSHQTKAGLSNEFQRLTGKNMLRRLQLGLSILRTVFDTQILGFVPPAWSAPMSILPVVKDAGLEYCVIDNSIYSLSSAISRSVVASYISLGTTLQISPNFALEMEFGGPLQLAVHPLDHSNHDIQSLLLELIDTLDYRPSGYSSYLTTIEK